MEKELNFIVVEETSDTKILADYEAGEIIIEIMPLEAKNQND